MARNIIVLIGSVTSKLYQPVRLEMLQRGIKPKIKRFEDIEVLFPEPLFGWDDYIDMYESMKNFVLDVEASEIAFVVVDSSPGYLDNDWKEALQLLWKRPVIDAVDLHSVHMMLSEALSIMDEKLELKNPNFFEGPTFERF